MLDKQGGNIGTDVEGSNGDSTLSGAMTANKGNKENIKVGYLIVHATVIALGFFQFGKYPLLRSSH